MQEQQQYQNGYTNSGANEGYAQGGHHGHMNRNGYNNYNNNGSWQQEYAQASAGPYQREQQYQSQPARVGHAQMNGVEHGTPRQQNPQQPMGAPFNSPPQQYTPQSSYPAYQEEQPLPGQAIIYDDRAHAASRQRQYSEQGGLRRPPVMERRGTGQSAASSSPATSQRQRGMVSDW